MWQSQGFILMLSVGAASTLLAKVLTVFLQGQGRAKTAVRECVFVLVLGVGHFVGSLYLMCGMVRLYTVAGFLAGCPLGAKMYLLLKKCVLALAFPTRRFAVAVNKAAYRLFAPINAIVAAKRQQRIKKRAIAKAKAAQKHKLRAEKQCLRRQNPPGAVKATLRYVNWGNQSKKAAKAPPEKAFITTYCRGTAQQNPHIAGK